MVTCFKCYFENKEDLTFCQKCGERLKQKNEDSSLNLVGCLDCNFIIRKRGESNKKFSILDCKDIDIEKFKLGFKFCPTCGKKLAKIRNLKEIKEKRVFAINWILEDNNNILGDKKNYVISYHLEDTDVYDFAAGYMKSFISSSQGKVFSPVRDSLRVVTISDSLYEKIIKNKICSTGVLIKN